MQLIEEPLVYSYLIYRVRPCSTDAKYLFQGQCNHTGHYPYDIYARKSSPLGSSLAS